MMAQNLPPLRQSAQPGCVLMVPDEGTATGRLWAAKQRYTAEAQRVTRKVTRLFAGSAPPEDPSVAADLLRATPHALPPPKRTRAQSHGARRQPQSPQRRGRLQGRVNRAALGRLRHAKQPAAPKLTLPRDQIEDAGHEELYTAVAELAGVPLAQASRRRPRASVARQAPLLDALFGLPRTPRSRDESPRRPPAPLLSVESRPMDPPDQAFTPRRLQLSPRGTNVQSPEQRPAGHGKLTERQRRESRTRLGVTGIESALDLSWRDLVAADVFLLNQVLAAHQHIRAVDLSGNDLQSVHEYRLLSDLLTSNRSIESVRLENTKMPAKWRAELQRMAAENHSARLVREDEARNRELMHRWDEWREERARHREHVLDEEREGRKVIVLMQMEGRRGLLHEAMQQKQRIHVRLQRRELRQQQLAELAALCTGESGARGSVAELYYRGYTTILDRADHYYRESLEKMRLAARTALRASYFESWRVARAQETFRMERERDSRLMMEGAETTARKAVEAAHSESLGRQRQVEVKHRRWVVSMLRARREMFNTETQARARIEEEEQEGLVFVRDRQKLEIQQHAIMLMQQRRAFEVGEEEERLIIVAEEERVRPILEEILNSYKDFIGLCLAFEGVSVDRTGILRVPPLLVLSRPVDAPLRRYVAGQRECDWMAVDSRTRLVLGMPSDWDDMCEEVKKKERAAWQAQRAQLTKQRGLKAKHKKLMLGAESSYLADMIDRAVTDMERTSDGAGTPVDPSRWPPTEQLRATKCRIWGGSICFQMVPDPELPEEWTAQDELDHPSKPAFAATPTAPLSPIRRRLVARNLFEVPPESPLFVSEECDSFDCSKLEIHLANDGSCTVADVNEMLRAVEYRCTIRAEQVTRPYYRSIRVSLRLRFADSDALLSLRPDEVPDGLTEIEQRGCFDVVVVPPHFYLQGDTRCVWREGEQKRQRPLLESVRTTRPSTVARKGDSVIVSEGPPDAHYEGSRVSIEFASGFTKDDFFGFKSGNFVFYSDAERTIRQKDEVLARVEAGVMLKGNDMYAGFQAPPGTGKRVVLSIVSPLCNSDNLKRLLERLRYFNVSRDPIIGVREVEIVLTDAMGFRSAVRLEIDVEATDDPAELTLQRAYVLYHANYASVTDDLKHHIVKYPLPVFHGCDLIDADTEFFVGGSIRVACTNMQRGDTLHLQEGCLGGDPHAHPDRVVVVPAGGADGAPEVWYGGHAIGELRTTTAEMVGTKRGSMAPLAALAGKIREQEREEREDVPEPTPTEEEPGARKAGPVEAAGPVSPVEGTLVRVESKREDPVRPRPKLKRPAAQTLVSAMGSLNPSRCYRELTLLFNQSGHATVAAAQQFLRSVVFYNPLTQPSMASTRVVEVWVQLGPTVFKQTVDGTMTTIADVSDAAPPDQPTLHETVHIRVTPALVSINPKLCVFKYTEGSGAQRLPAFDVVAEIHADAYEGGYLLVEVVEGRSTDDVLNLREEGITVTLREWVDHVQHRPQRKSFHSSRQRQSEAGLRQNSRTQFRSSFVSRLVSRSREGSADDGEESVTRHRSGRLSSRLSGRLSAIIAQHQGLVSRQTSVSEPTAGDHVSPSSAASPNPSPNSGPRLTMGPRGGQRPGVAAPDPTEALPGLSVDPASPMRGGPRVFGVVAAAAEADVMQVSPEGSVCDSDCESVSVAAPEAVGASDLLRSGSADDMGRRKSSALDRLRGAARDLAAPTLSTVADHMHRKSVGREADGKGEARTVALLQERIGQKRHGNPQDRAAWMGAESISVSDLSIESRPIGTLLVDRGHSSMTVQFPKGTPVRRRDVVTLLRSLTYSNSNPDPQFLTKTLRVQLNCGQWASSQALVQVHIQTIDDVTEILLRESRVKYRSCPDDERLPLCIAPLHAAKVYDPDTPYFDGGSLLFELVSGGARGDNLQLLTREQQLEQIRRQELSVVAPSLEGAHEDSGAVDFIFAEPLNYLFTVDERTKDVVFDDGAVCHLSYPKAVFPGAHDFRVTFPKVQGDGRISREHVTFLMNCVAFNGSERTKEGIRTYQIRVSDGINAQEGKTRLSVDVRAPLIMLPPHAHCMDAEPGQSIALCPRISATLADGLVFTSGFCEVEVMTGMLSGKGGDALQLSLKEQGFRIDGGALYQGPHLMGVLQAADPEVIRLEFVAGSKMRGGQLTQFLRSVYFRVGHGLTGLDDEEKEEFQTKTVAVVVAEDDSPRVSKLTVTIAVGARAARKE